MIEIVKATRKHLPELARLLERGGQCAYVLGSKYPLTPLTRIYETGWLYVVLRNGRTGGMFFITDIDNRSARIHFGVFDPGMELVKGSREVLQWLVPEHFDTLFGCLNAGNDRAVSFALLLGFKKLHVFKNGGNKMVLTVYPSSN